MPHALGRPVLVAAVAAVAIAAAGATVAITLTTRTDPGAAAAGATTTSPVQRGRPPLSLDLGVRTDPEATALRQAAALYADGKAAAAGAAFRRYRSDEARVGAALAGWPKGYAALTALGVARPASSLVQLHLGIARFWRGDAKGARSAWRRALDAQPDTPYALRAEDLLFPNFPRGVPTLVPSFPIDPSLGRLTAVQQYRELERRAHGGGWRDHVLYGIALQRLGRRVSALQEFRLAAAAAPDELEPKVAVAVGSFTKDSPSDAFSQLGPLGSAYPDSADVRFHLGLLLLWLGTVTQAKAELEKAQAAEPGSLLAREAARYLAQLRAVG